MRLRDIIGCAAALLAVATPAAAQRQPLPRIERTAQGSQLLVDGQPYVFIGGELHNSSPSSPRYMGPVWDKLVAMNVRSVIGSVSWGEVEPKEGEFDFSTVDAQVAEGRKRGIRLALIWFGAYKNARSTYTPGWVRADTRRFQRAAINPQGKELFTYPGAMQRAILSVFSPQLLEADRRAFVAFMRHLAKIDPDHTVIMVQVENEPGLLRDSRDRSPLAEAAWRKPVPAALIDYMVRNEARLRPEFAALWARQGKKRVGSWPEVFGTDWQAEEVFMAWGFGSYIDALAKAGRAIKQLPMYANAWIAPQPGQTRAGEYPSGGAVTRVLDVWKAAGPNLALLAPDVYIPEERRVFGEYARPDNPLFVPEARFKTGNLFWALGHNKAIGFSVFGIESGRGDNQYARALGVLNPMRAIIARAQTEGRIAGILLEDDEPKLSFKLGDFTVNAQGSRALMRTMLLDAGVQPPPPAPALPSETIDGALPSPGDSRPFGLIIAEGDDSFLLVGQGLTIDFAHGSQAVEIDHVEEGSFDAAGQWVPGRVMNGDERLAILPVDRIGVARMRLLRTQRVE